MHDPAHAEAVAEGRRVGGQNRRRETVLHVVHDFEGLGSIAQIRRLLEIAVSDCLGSERSLNRAKALAYLVQTATKLLVEEEAADARGVTSDRGLTIIQLAPGGDALEYLKAIQMAGEEARSRP
jgi:hypothetical protein